MDTGSRIRIGEWVASPSRNLLERNGRTVRLEPRTMDVLVALAMRAGDTVSLEDLMRTVWKQVVVSDSSVYLAISQLRQVLDEPGKAGYIETVPKRGYRLTAAVQAIPEAAGSAPPAEKASGRRSGRFALALALLLLVACGAWLWRSMAREARAVAVLPFQNLSGDVDQGYFADGMTIEILNSLSRIDGLRVIGRSSSFLVPDASRNPRDAAELLGVRYVLTGSVRRSGDALRIAAQLDDASNGEQLWASTFDRPLADIFAVQDEIATAVAGALQIRLGIGALSRQPGMTRNVAAYDEYVRGMAANLEWRESAFPEAIARLRRAVALDPDFSLAWSLLNTVCGNAALAYPERAEEWRETGAQAMARARELAPDEPPVLLAQGIDELRRGQWRTAAATYARLDTAYLRLGQQDEAAGPRGIFLLGLGHAREAIPDLERARAHEPLAPAFAGFLAEAHIVAGNFRAALAEVDRGLALQGLDAPLRRVALRAALNMRDIGEIRRRVAALDEAMPGSVHAAMAAYLDRPADAPAAIRERAATANANGKLALADWAAYYRAPELALELLVQGRSNLAKPGLLWEPLMSEVRALPGFRDVLAQSDIVEHWRASRWPEFCRPGEGDEFFCS